MNEELNTCLETTPEDAINMARKTLENYELEKEYVIIKKSDLLAISDKIDLINTLEQSTEDAHQEIRKDIEKLISEASK